LVQNIKWRQAKVVGRDQNTGELALRYNDRGESINAGRKVADYAGGLDCLDKLLQKVFSVMDIRDPQARIFMNYYEDGKHLTGVHRHDFWTCLLSFGASRILTVDNRPFLLRNGDLIVFGTQNHGVPIMPDVTGGRISLVIFFYPDADNLERQWQTITEDDDNDGEKSLGTDSQVFSHGVDQGFRTSLLWGGTDPHDSKPCCQSGKKSALDEVLDPNTQKRALLQSPNSDFFKGASGVNADESVNVPIVVFSIVSDLSGDPSVAERDFFRHLTNQSISGLWDFRFKPLAGSWGEPQSLKRTCTTRAIKYRHYPIGRRAAGGIDGHLRSEEGRDIMKRFLVRTA